MVHAEVDAERELLRDSAEKFVARSYGIEERAKLAREAPGFSAQHWATFAELGWLAILAPESAGGIGATFADAAVLAEAFGRGLLLEPFVAAVGFAGTLLAAAGDGPAATALAGLIEGTALVVPAYREANDGFHPERIATRARADGDALLVDGEKIAVPYAAAADSLLVSARDTEGRTFVVLIDPKQPGVRIDERTGLDAGRTARVTFSGAFAKRALAGPEAAVALVTARDAAAALTAAEAVGVMSRAYDDTARYVRERIQFGKPIATFQVARHRIADMYVECELARAAAADAAEALDAGDPSCARRVSAAIVHVARSGRFVCEHAVQLHGAIGIAAEGATGNALARMTTLGAVYGDAAYHLNRYLDAAPEGT